MSNKFDDLLSFPTRFNFRLIVYANDSVVEECKNVLASVFGEVQSCEVLPSSSGRFYRVHILVLAKSAAELYSGYEALRSVDGIKMVI
ncbi:MAG: DUF493 domain-containing protein [Myxococcota bacterium]|nr:DUF493 domain-containing protein [Myxococcota bacterium]